MVDEFLDILASFLAAFQRGPVLFGTIMAVGLVAIWLKWWVIDRASRSAQKDNFAGWTTSAAKGTQRHITGLGTQDVTVMKMHKFLSLSLMVIGFFGSCALVFWFLILPEPDVTLKDKLVFAGSLVFVLMGFWTLTLAFLRIRYNGEEITRTSLFRRRFRAVWSDLAEVTPIGKTYATGLTLRFHDGRKLRVPARMTGYADLMRFLSKHDPQLAVQALWIGQQLRKAL